MRRVQEDGLREARNVIASKNETAELLSEKMRTAEPQYVASIAGALSRVMGYDAPSRAQIEVRSVPANVEAWLSSCLTIDVAVDDKQLSESNPPKALLDKPFPPSD